MELVFRLQWATKEGIETFKRNGTHYYSYERMQKLLDDAYEAGRKVGDLEGRVALRELLESEGSLR